MNVLGSIFVKIIHGILTMRLVLIANTLETKMIKKGRLKMKENNLPDYYKNCLDAVYKPNSFTKLFMQKKGRFEMKISTLFIIVISLVVGTTLAAGFILLMAWGLAGNQIQASFILLAMMFSCGIYSAIYLHNRKDNSK